jgi:predicted ATPase/DNA-binding XRE family transcriptional regulator
MESRDALGDLLRRLRMQAGLSQERLGSAAGVDARTISDIERSVTRYPRAETVHGIADALQLTPADRENWITLASAPADAIIDADLAITAGLAATSLAEALSDLRQRRGISARELSQRTGLAVRSISDIEAGRRKKVHPGNAIRLADQLGLHGDARERFLQLAAGAPLGPPAAAEARPTSLLGRERELAEVADLALSSPLVVLTGPGGVGKTALAEAVLGRLDRPHLTVDLTRVPAGQDLARAIAVVSGFDEGADAAWVDQLAALLPPRAVLLLDNLEHLQGAGKAVEAILASRPDLTVLATSRTSSGLDDGAEYAVGPLQAAAACQVFREVARRSGRPLAARIPAALIEQVCVRLDLLPLNIVLAAAWSRLMTPQEILARLDRSTEILRTVGMPGHRTSSGQPRHATVANTVGWSLALLSGPASALFRALAAYPGPWPLDLVEAVCPTARLDPLHELVEAGLVTGSDNDAGGTSYAMLQTVRDVGSAELSGDPGWHAEVLERHAAHLLGRARTLGPKLVTAERPAALVECDELAPHVQGALEHLIGSADGRAVSLAAAWWQYWFHRGQYRRGLAVLAQALAVRPVAGDSPAQDTTTALYGAAALAYYGGQQLQAARYAADALARARALGDSRRIGSVISLIGMMEFYSGQHQAALDWYQRGLAEVDSESEPETYATLLTNAAPVYAVLGDIAAARSAAQDAARRCQAIGNLAGVATNLGNLAEWAARTGDREEARELLSECRELQKSVGDSYNVAQCILSLGKLSADEGDAATAQEELDAARQQMQGTDDPWGDAFGDALAAQIAVLNGDMTTAHNRARLAVRKAEALGYEPAIVTAALADASAAAWSNDLHRTLEPARLGLSHSEQADEAAVVSLSLLVAAVHADGAAAAQIDEDVLAVERLVSQWASVPGCAPYPIAARSARRRGLKIGGGDRGASRGHVPPIDELRQLALTLCGPGPGTE